MDFQEVELHPDLKIKPLRKNGDEQRKFGEHMGRYSEGYFSPVSDSHFSAVPLNAAKENVRTEAYTRNANLNFTINLCKRCKLNIYKPLVPLRLMLFCWYGAGSFLTPFITVYFKQRGITLDELSTAYIVAPAAQFGGTLLSGVIADKLGRSKPVLVSNLVLTVVMIICIISTPRPSIVDCNIQAMKFECHSHLFEPKQNCDTVEILLDTVTCNAQCLENVEERCVDQDFQHNDKQNINRTGERQLFSLIMEGNRSLYEGLCSFKNLTICKCDSPSNIYCNLTCGVQSDRKCFDKGMLNIAVMLFYMMLMVVYSNCYRFLDVTAMYLVEEHKSDFGRERFFAIAGNLMISPFAGYLVGATTPDKGEKNYTAAFYLFIALIIFILLIVYKLDVRINAPGKKMAKKSIILLKNPDVLSFALIVFVLGTAWSFTTKFLFWYLEELKAPSILIGLIPAIGALYGLPFLLTSSWWMEKIGTTKMFVIGLLGYVLNAVGYSVLTNPWISLVLEATNVVTYHLLWVAVVLHSHELAPEGLTATVISIAGSMHYHIGKSSGSLIGGLVMSKYGGKKAFEVVAIVCFMSAVLYAFYLYYRYKRFRRTSVPQKGESAEGQRTNYIN